MSLPALGRRYFNDNGSRQLAIVFKILLSFKPLRTKKVEDFYEQSKGLCRHSWIAADRRI
jgi:hypothetical protein